jgi:hypothetical protein
MAAVTATVVVSTEKRIVSGQNSVARNRKPRGSTCREFTMLSPAPERQESCSARTNLDFES